MCVFNFIVTIDYMVVVLLHNTLHQNCSLNPMYDWKQKLFLAKPQLNLFARVNLLRELCTYTSHRQISLEKREDQVILIVPLIEKTETLGWRFAQDWPLYLQESSAHCYAQQPLL